MCPTVRMYRGDFEKIQYDAALHLVAIMLSAHANYRIQLAIQRELSAVSIKILMNR